jgi:hypothetical protein
MPYIPDWEPLAEALTRVIATGVSQQEAKIDLCHAGADRKIGVRVRIAESDSELGGRSFFGANVRGPTRLKPDDFDWAQSRPRHKWSVGPVGPQYYTRVTWSWKSHQIDLIELATADVLDIFGSPPSKPRNAEEASGANDRTPEQLAADEIVSGKPLHGGIPKAPRRTHKMPPMPRKPGARQVAWKALKERFPDEQIPLDFTGEQLTKIVNQFLSKLPSDAIEGRVKQEVSLDTVLRAAGRKT